MSQIFDHHQPTYARRAVTLLRSSTTLMKSPVTQSRRAQRSPTITEGWGRSVNAALMRLSRMIAFPIRKRVRIQSRRQFRQPFCSGRVLKNRIDGSDSHQYTLDPMQHPEPPLLRVATLSRVPEAAHANENDRSRSFGQRSFANTTVHIAHFALWTA